MSDGLNRMIEGSCALCLNHLFIDIVCIYDTFDSNSEIFLLYLFSRYDVTYNIYSFTFIVRSLLAAARSNGLHKKSGNRSRDGNFGLV